MILSKKRIFWWAVFIIGILMIPFIAMKFTNEVTWNITDFVMMAGLLIGIAFSYELIAQKSKQKVYRIAFGLGLLGAFLLLWVNGAVGIIGNEGQDANLLYGAVFVLGFVGVILSRFKAKGMSITLYIMTLAQMLVPTIALFIWPPSKISWSPGVISVFIISGFFAFLFFISGILFSKAAAIKE